MGAFAELAILKGRAPSSTEVTASNSDDAAPSVPSTNAFSDFCDQETCLLTEAVESSSGFSTIPQPPQRSAAFAGVYPDIEIPVDAELSAGNETSRHKLPHKQVSTLV